MDKMIRAFPEKRKLRPARNFCEAMPAHTATACPATGAVMPPGTHMVQCNSIQKFKSFCQSHSHCRCLPAMYALGMPSTPAMYVLGLWWVWGYN
jgi:hypothetical protein